MEDQRMAGDLLGEELLQAFDLQELMPVLREGLKSGMSVSDLLYLLSSYEREQQRLTLIPR
jgi:hypothetical protein